MAQYAVLVNWTGEGIRSVKNVPQRAEQFREAVEGAGGRVLVFLHTMGAYDAVAAVELPGDDTANTVLLRLGAQGFARTTTLKGWTTSEISRLVEKL